MSGGELTRSRVVVHGRVQGVYFRDSCRAEAEAAGVCGEVSNAPDGTVEAVFEGPPDAVRRLVDWCREGPSSARVTGVDVTHEPVEGVRGFTVR